MVHCDLAVLGRAVVNIKVRIFLWSPDLEHVWVVVIKTMAKSSLGRRGLICLRVPVVGHRWRKSRQELKLPQERACRTKAETAENAVHSLHLHGLRSLLSVTSRTTCPRVAQPTADCTWSSNLRASLLGSFSQLRFPFSKWPCLVSSWKKT